MPLGNPLTGDGVEALVESVKRDLVSNKKFEREVGRLLAHVWGDYLQDMLARVLLPPKLPGLEQLLGRRYALDRVVLADACHLYLLGQVAGVEGSAPAPRLGERRGRLRHAGRRRGPPGSRGGLRRRETTQAGR